jgi:hypothetical protein
MECVHALTLLRSHAPRVCTCPFEQFRALDVLGNGRLGMKDLQAQKKLAQQARPISRTRHLCARALALWCPVLYELRSSGPARALALTVSRLRFARSSCTCMARAATATHSARARMGTSRAQMASSSLVSVPHEDRTPTTPAPTNSSSLTTPETPIW